MERLDHSKNHGEQPETSHLMGNTHNTYSLSPRQTESLMYAAMGLSNVEIAEILVISPFTVRYHLYHAYRALGTSDRIAAIMQGISLGLVTPDEFLKYYPESLTSRIGHLSERERQILQTMAENGKTKSNNRALGAELKISSNTIRVHMSSIFYKLEVNNRYQATMTWVAYQERLRRTSGE